MQTKIKFKKSASSAENNIIYLLRNHAKQQPRKDAIRWVEPETLKLWDARKKIFKVTYSEIFDKISRIAEGLKKLNIKKHDRIIIFLPFTLPLYLSMLAVQKIGAAAVFIDSWSDRGGLETAVKAAQPKGMISFEGAFNMCKEAKELKDIPIKIVAGVHAEKYSADLSELILTDGTAQIEPMEPDDTALITFTTGSSGAPKGANRTHGFLMAQHKALHKCLPYQKQDIDLSIYPIFLLNNLAEGITTILPAVNLAEPKVEDSSIIARQIINLEITTCTLSPSIFTGVAEFCLKKNIKLSKLRRAATGGAPVSKENIKKFKMIAPQAQIRVLYGSTEVEPISYIDSKNLLSDAEEKEGVNAGKILEDLEYKFIKIHKGDIEINGGGLNMWEVEKGKIGELIVSGKHVCKDYYKNSKAVKSSKIMEKSGKIWHRTGDAGYLDLNNDLWLVGWVYNAVLRKGEYLFSVRPELLLKKLEFVKHAAFLGIKDGVLGEKTVVVVSMKEKKDTDKEEYICLIREALVKNKIIADEIKIIDEIPMDPRHQSKVEYSKLREIIK